MNYGHNTNFTLDKISNRNIIISKKHKTIIFRQENVTEEKRMTLSIQFKSMSCKWALLSCKAYGLLYKTPDRISTDIYNQHPIAATVLSRHSDLAMRLYQGLASSKASPGEGWLKLGK